MYKRQDKNILSLDSTRINSFEISAGGDALNVAINTAKLGVRSAVAGRIGKDFMGDFLLHAAEACGVDTRGVIACDGMRTSSSMILVDDTGERHCVYYGKANDTFCFEDVDWAFAKDARIMHLGSAMLLKCMDGDGIERLFQRAQDYGILCSLDVTNDTDNKWLEKIEKALYFTDVFLPSYEEACRITGLTDVYEMKAFFKKYNLKMLAVKLGAAGCFVTDYRNDFEIDTFSDVPVVDTTGAGDAFVSGFLTALSKGCTPYACGVFGNAVASMSVSETGSTAGVKSYEETVAFIRKYRT